MPTSMLHALIVDDDPVSSSALRDMVILEGYSSVIATSLKQGLQQIALKKPDLIFCELCLPDGSGSDLFQSIDPADHIKIILLTDR